MTADARHSEVRPGKLFGRVSDRHLLRPIRTRAASPLFISERSHGIDRRRATGRHQAGGYSCRRQQHRHSPLKSTQSREVSCVQVAIACASVRLNTTPAAKPAITPPAVDVNTSRSTSFPCAPRAMRTFGQLAQTSQIPQIRKQWALGEQIVQGVRQRWANLSSVRVSPQRKD